MKYLIEVGIEGMPQDIDDAKSGGTYGPFSSEKTAETALKRKGWFEAETGKWRALSSIPGDRSVAVIVPLEERRRLRGRKSLPRR